MGGFVATSFQFINKYVSRKNEAVLWSLKNEATDKNYFNSMKMTGQNRNRLRP